MAVVVDVEPEPVAGIVAGAEPVVSEPVALPRLRSGEYSLIVRTVADY